MQPNWLDFIEEVEKLGERYDLGVYEVTVGEDPVVIIKLWIEKPRVEVTTIGNHCTVTDGTGKRKSFETSLSGWDQRSLEFIEELLTAYKKLGRQ